MKRQQQQPSAAQSPPRKGSAAAVAADARARYDARVEETAHIGSTLVDRTCAYDTMAKLIMSRDSSLRRVFVERLRDTLATRYASEFNNPDDTFAQQMFREFFDYCLRTDSPEANQLQMFAVHWAMLIERDVLEWLRPPPPDPSAEGNEAVDQSRVDRVAFAMYENELDRMYQDMVAGRSWTVASFVRSLNARYIASLPPNPLDAALHELRTRPGTARRVRFADPEARRRVNEMLAGGGADK